MQTKIKFYKDRVAVNFLAKDKKNGADVFNAIDGYTAIGVLSKQFDTVEEGIEYVKDYMKDVPVVSVGLGAGDPAQFQKAALIAAATDPGHVNQVFTGAAYAAGALKAMKAENTAVNVLMSTKRSAILKKRSLLTRKIIIWACGLPVKEFPTRGRIKTRIVRYTN